MKISFYGEIPVLHEDVMRNIEHARKTGLPYARYCKEHGRALAVVGGGPSILEKLEELRNFDGDIWAINGTCNFLASHAIKSTMIGVDPHEIVCQWAHGVKKALLCERTDYRVWEILKDADVRLFTLAQDDAVHGVVCGSSTATCAFDLATELGYRKIVFYGCESSYPGDESGNENDVTHAYSKEMRDHRLLVECGGKNYLTAPDFYIQAQELSGIIKAMPAHFTEKSGGLLRAMIENDDYDIVKVSKSLMDTLTPVYAEAA